MTETRDLPVKLSDAEIMDRGEQLAAAVADHTRETISAKEERAEIKARLDAAMARVRRLADAVKDGSETKPVECTLAFDREHGRAIITRDDTGDVVESRPMTAREIEDLDQGKLFGPDADADAMAVADKMDDVARRAKARAEFSLPAWAGERITAEQVEKLVAAGYAEVPKLLAATHADIADAGDIDPLIAARLLDDLETEFGGPVDAIDVLTAGLGDKKSAAA